MLFLPAHFDITNNVFMKAVTITMIFSNGS